MISQGGKNILERFVLQAKNLLTENVTSLLQQYYGIWKDGHQIGVEQLASQDTDVVHTAKMLRERLKHIVSSLPENASNKEKTAVEQLIAEQAFTILNRFCALRMCEERELILPAVSQGFNSAGFLAYDEVSKKLQLPTYQRYTMFIHSVFDELSIELPSVFDRFSPYGLIFPDEQTLIKLLDLLNQADLSNWYDEQNGCTLNFWKEDETLGWIFQDYNSLEERRKMREESNKPRNSREMAVRNQFFTPEYIVRFLTDNSLGRIWYEMTGGQSEIADKVCKYMVIRPDEELIQREIKEPTEIRTMDPTCGSMHFGIYVYEVYEYIYLDAWDNHPNLLHSFRELYSRESFRKQIPALILENNIYGCEIDPRALQLAALSLWLRAQRSYSEMNILPAERPLITRSNLVLAESMPGNKRLLKGLLEEVDAPTRRLINKVWEKMQFVGEAGLLFKMEKEIDDEIDYLRQNWAKVNQFRYATLFSTDEERARIEAENATRKALKQNKEEFFTEITSRLKEALQQLSSKLSEEEGYENTLFTEDATRGFAFLELCQKRFDCIVMNPPFGEGSENTSPYLDANYPAWCRNLVCAFFDRMQEMLDSQGKLGAIFDRTVMIKSSYENFRKRNLCGFITNCADTGWGVLDASVETSTLVLNKYSSDVEGVFMDVLDINPEEKNNQLCALISALKEGEEVKWNHIRRSIDFSNLPNTIIGYYFAESVLNLFKFRNIEDRNIVVRQGHAFVSTVHYRLFYELSNSHYYKHMYNGGSFTQFYSTNREVAYWGSDGEIVKANSSVVLRNPDYQLLAGIGYGKRGEIVDAHVLHDKSFFTVEGLALTQISESNRYSVLSLINSILGQYSINQYCAQHKHAGYMNLLPMPDYASRQSDIERIDKDIIDIKRLWFSLDETNLEYHGLIAQMNISTSVDSALDAMQERLTEDYARYMDLVKENDDLWMDLAGIDRNSEFRQTLVEYKNRRPYEELLSIDGASSGNIIDKKVMAQEIILELVGMAFGRWDIAYAKREKEIPAFGDVFDALPFMPVVSLTTQTVTYPLSIPADGILSNDINSNICISTRVRDVMLQIWGENADDIEYELCQLIGFHSLQEYFEKPTGFFDYHFKRYTKSRRKAPIYWPMSSDDGSITYWVYYPLLSRNTIPALISYLRQDMENAKHDYEAAHADNNRVKEAKAMERQTIIETFIKRLEEVLAIGYEPNHDDGVPVTAAPLVAFFQHRAWHDECKENWDDLQKGEYDWSHLAFKLYPGRITNKAKKDYCMALTHGLESICENKPKEKKTRKKTAVIQTTLNLE